jgi:hypothetical protein
MAFCSDFGVHSEHYWQGVWQGTTMKPGVDAFLQSIMVSGV